VCRLALVALTFAAAASGCGEGRDDGQALGAAPGDGVGSQGQLVIEERRRSARAVPHVRVIAAGGQMVLDRAFRGAPAEGRLGSLRLDPGSYVLETYVSPGARARRIDPLAGYCTAKAALGAMEVVTATIVRRPRAPCSIGIDRISFRDLAGRRVEDAARFARGYGFMLRVVERDGRSLPVTEDLRLDRVNVAVEGDRVTAVKGLY
jgi:hypothetical protein